MVQRLNTELITAAINGFQEQKKRIDSQIAELRQMLEPSTPTATTVPTKRRRFSAAVRRRMAAAQRARWAAKRAAGTVAPKTAAPRKKRKLSAAGAKAIIEATKRRWAASRAAKRQ